MNDFIFQQFKSRISALGLFITLIDANEVISVSDGNTSMEVSLEAAEIVYNKDASLQPLDELTEHIARYFGVTEIPAWQQAKDLIYYYLLPASHPVDSIIHQAVTTLFYRAFALYQTGRYIPITTEHLDKWEINREELEWQAGENMNLLLEGSRIELLETDSHERIVLLDNALPGFTSALIFATNLRQKLVPMIGFPLYCAIPVRNCCYLFAEEDMQALIDLLGETVMKTYQESDAKITTEILRISETGVEAIGRYAL